MWLNEACAKSVIDWESSWFLPGVETSSRYYSDIWKQEGGIGSLECLPQQQSCASPAGLPDSNVLFSARCEGGREMKRVLGVGFFSYCQNLSHSHWEYRSCPCVHVKLFFVVTSTKKPRAVTSQLVFWNYCLRCWLILSHCFLPSPCLSSPNKFSWT